MDPIIPIVRKERFDDPAWLFELKYDGFRGIADTIRYRMLSKNLKRLQRFEPLLDTLPAGYVFRRRDRSARRDRPTAIQRSPVRPARADLHRF
jgi:hypothetical protein